jgi:hypothetical protein
VVGLYTNIPHDEGVESVKRALNSRKKSRRTNRYTDWLFETSAKVQYVQFNSKLYQQEIGMAMGTRVAPTMANILMSEMDTKIQNWTKTKT